LYEAGAVYAKELNNDGDYRYHPLKVTPLKYKLNLENPQMTNLLLSEDSPDMEVFGFLFF
jgi:hypothetical protein